MISAGKPGPSSMIEKVTAASSQLQRMVTLLRAKSTAF
jgi:hypothetical protein